MIPYLDLHIINAPYAEQIKSAMQRVVDSGWYLFGGEVAAFEREWAAYCGAQHCTACANGLDALRLVLR
ncbi:MAG: DegT/DnrJ/EryC1/StrS aminotransferase family protein, partial [Bacteroidales bacterium]|nr:DegT/DnrJ/EryC1/StrS aminotransferase family protein [Bacteroidales bacterium]